MAQDIDYAEHGLLQGAESERERQARVELLDYLRDQGVELDELKEAVDEGRLAVLPVERMLSRDSQHLSRRDLAEEVEIEPELLRRTHRALGMAVPDDDERAFDDEDLEAARELKQFREAGLPDEGLLQISRVMGQGISQLASTVRTVFGDAFVQAGDTERDVAMRYARMTEQLRPRVEPMLSYVFSLHLREAVRGAMVEALDLSTGEVGDTQQVAVCFADLVDFTKLGQQVPTDQLGEVAGRLSEIAFGVVESPVRVVKLIGDAAMLVGPRPEPVVDAALSMVEAAEQESEDFPQIHAGVAFGEALERGGDWYGSTVNLASRLTDAAYPGSVLATNAIRDAAPEAFAYSEAGWRKFKGFDERIGTLRVRRPDAEADG